MSKLKLSKKAICYLTTAGITLMYALAYFFPQHFWTTHSLVFLPTHQAIFLWILSLSIFAFSTQIAHFFYERGISSAQPKLARWIEQLLLAVIVGSIVYMFPLAHQAYGDARYFIPQIDIVVTEMPAGMVARLFQFDLVNGKLGAETFYIFVNLLSYSTGKNGVEVLFTAQAFLAMIFCFAWFQAVAAYLAAGLQRATGYVIGASAPFMQAFYSHAEIYAFELTALMVYFSLLLLYFSSGKKGYLWALIPVLFLVIRCHISGWIFIPITLLIGLFVLEKKHEKISRFFEWKNLKRYFLLPIYLLGIVVYLFITDSFFGKRDFSPDTLTDVIFLPVVADEIAPLDRYNLLSFAHIWDFANLVFVWSPAALLLIITGLSLFKKHIDWHQPALMFSLLALCLYIPLFFCLNPLLSIPMDWDLMSLIAPSFLIVALLMYAQFPRERLTHIIAVLTLGCAILGSSFMFCNAQEESMSRRLDALGRYIFKTFHLGCSTTLSNALELSQDDDERLAMRLDQLTHLSPYATPNNDIEYAGLLEKTGLYFMEKNAYSEALAYFEKAYEYEANLKSLSYHLVITYFMLGKYARAHAFGDELIALGYPSPKRAHRIALHTALEAGAYDDARYICNLSLQQWPNDSTVIQVARDLDRGENVDQIKNYFKQQ